MVEHYEIQYYKALQELLQKGQLSEDRTGTGTIRKQHQYFCLDLQQHGLPLLHGKQIFWKSAITEAVWIMLGRTDLQFLKDNGCGYWDKWVKEDGTFGPIYGAQMRNFNGVDQLANAIEQIKINPNSRQIVISLWNPKDLKDMALPPCHCFYQFCKTGKVLDMHVTQRSADSFIGVPYDFVLFTVFLLTVCHITKSEVGKIHYTCNDFHLYKNHIEPANIYLERILLDNINSKYLSEEIIFGMWWNHLHYLNISIESVCENWLDLKESDEVKCDMAKEYKHYGPIKADVSV